MKCYIEMYNKDGEEKKLVVHAPNLDIAFDTANAKYPDFEARSGLVLAPDSGWYVFPDPETTCEVLYCE